MFRNHPAGIRVDAEIPDLKSATPEDIQRFIRRYYVAANMFVVMFGPPFREVSEIVHNTFSHWPKMPPPKTGLDRFGEFQPLRRKLYEEEHRRGIHQTHVAVGFRTEGYSSQDSIALDILAEIWRYHLSARLREQNRSFNAGTYRVYALSERTFVHGLLGAHFATTSARYADYGRLVILEESQRLAEQLPDVAVFHAAQKSLRNQFRCCWGNVPLWTCEQVAMATSNGDPDLIGLHSYPERLDAVTRRDIRRVAQKYFVHPHGLAVIRPR